MLPRVLDRGPFRLLFAGQAVSSLGDRIVPVALAFAILDLTGSPTDLGIVVAARTLPLVMLVLLGGVWGDRLPRQLVMLASDGVRCVAQGLSAGLLLSGQAHVWQLAALQALYGAAQAFFGPSLTALVPQTVEPAELQQANALIGLTDNAASVLGPALAGALIAILSPGWALALDAATFVVSTFCLALMRVDRAPALSRSSTLSDLRDGWHAFISRPWLWLSVMFFTLYMAFAYSPFQVLGPQVARASLGGPGAWAAISAALGAGALAGGALSLRWRPLHPLRVGFLSFLLAGPAMLAGLAAHASLAVLLPLALVDGVSGSLFNALWFTAQQSEIPAEELSRVSSWDYLGTLALQPVGLALSGPIAAAIGVSSALYGAGGLILLLGLAILAVPSVRNFTARRDGSSPINRVNT